MANLDILLDAKGIGLSSLEKFEKAGYNSVEEVGMESPNELSKKVSGVGYTTAISVLKHLEKEGYREEKKNDDELEKLVELLQELFEFDTKDRDFGVYKLMNANREKIDKFIQEDLVNTIETEIEQIQNEFSGTSESEARDEVLEELGTGEFFDENNNTSKKAKELIESKNDGVSENELENIRANIYNHIHQFFSNYYNDGDFINRRKRSHHDEPYSVPYDGSNINFHWVTKNQYYAKTSEQFMRFKFNHQNNLYKFNTINSEYEGSGIGNNKYFVMDNIENIDISNNKIKVNFYRRMIGEDDLERFEDMSKGTRSKQNKMNETFTEELTNKLREENVAFEREELQKRIDEYTKRNQNDFFIHKNLDKFLQSELEEYIKTEIVKFKPSNGINNVTDISMEKARIVNEISMDIISFISQIEEFKRKLFKKKKFVIDSKKLIQISEVPENYYKILLENKRQLESWEESYNINTTDLTEDKLKVSPYNQMVVDTTYFDTEIKTKEEPRNKLIKGDNYQSLNFIEEKYKNKVKAIYIDPPYNTGNATFAYKDKYQRPTWLSMMYDRIRLSKRLLKEDGVIFVSIGRKELSNLERIMDNIYNESNKIAKISRVTKTGGAHKAKFINPAVDYILVYANDKSKVHEFEEHKDEEYMNRYNKEDKKGRYILRSLYRAGLDDRPNQKYTVECPDGQLVKPPEDKKGVFGWSKSRFEKEKKNGNIVIKQSDQSPLVTPDGEETRWNVYKKNYASDMSPKPSDYIDDQPNSKDNLSDFGLEYDYPKPSSLIKYLLEIIELSNNEIILDFFAGSGTTGQAVQELNRKSDRQLNYVLVEMLDKAFNITEERAKRVAFSNEWKNGEPKVDKEITSLGYTAECIKLESYEDALDAVKFDTDQSSLGDFKETLLNYILKFGTKDSPVFLDTDQLSKPKEYALDGELNEKPVDIMTTFNYLIGLDSVTKETMNIDDVKYTIYEGVKHNENICVIWRHNAYEANYKLEKEELEVDNYDRVYINGDSVLDNSIPISSEFKKQMFND